MKTILTTILFVIVFSSFQNNLLAMGGDFSKEELKKGWKHCIHGFWANEEVVKFYQGDTKQLNKDLKEFANGLIPFNNYTIVIHSGTKRVWSPWDKKPRNEFADWSIHTFHNVKTKAQKPSSGYNVKFDIWLGNKIDLDSLVIPSSFKVKSGGEIESFIKNRSQPE